MDPQTTQSLDAFHDEIRKSAEIVVFQTFPAKILELHKYITDASSPTSPFQPSQARAGTDTVAYLPDEEVTSKKRKLANGDSGGDSEQKLNTQYSHIVKTNLTVVDLHAKVKQETDQMTTALNIVKLWVTLTMPKIEDGDNFGVQIQQEVLDELHRAQESCFNLRDCARQNHLSRAKICTKLIKYPNVEDYKLAMKENDERQATSAQQYLTDIRNMYAELTDVIHKNIAKIRTPKANNSVSLY